MSHLTEQQEWDELLARVPLESTTTEAATELGRLLADAVQAQRPWARERLNEALHAGLAKVWRSHVQKQRPKVKTKNGDVKGVGGVRRRSGAQVTWAQVPLDLMSFDELVQYRQMHVTNLTTLRANADVVDRLLALQEEAPDAANPAAACDALGLDLDAVMAGAA